MNRLAIIVPCFNEEEVLSETIKRLSELLSRLIDKQKVSSNSYILFVNDGSADTTWNLIAKYHNTNNYVCGVNLANNVGHQNALISGISVASENCNMSVTIDADLQDDVDAIEQMIDKYHEGNDIVYGVRKNRYTDTWFKRNTALFFYSLMQKLGNKSVYNHADFRLMSQRAMKQLLKYSERNLFLRGLVPLIGYKTDCVYYDRTERFAGTSKYPFSKMVSFACDGITSFSTKPVTMIIYLGTIFIGISFLILCWTIYSFINGRVVPGWTSLILSIWFCSGCILLALGILGVYIGKIYIEVKQRPRYNIEEVLL